MKSALVRTITLSVVIMVIVFFTSNVTFAADSDGDGLDNPNDNCIVVANGPLLGTCTAGDTLGAPCTSNGECGTGGFCSMNQEDTDLDNFGDACDYCEGSSGAFDIDADGFCDGEDSCPSVPNPDQVTDVCINGIQRLARFDIFEGSWQEIGRQIAHTYPDNILNFATTFTLIVDVLGPPGWTAQSYYDAIEALIPQSIKDHMQGMAMGLTEVRPVTYVRAWDMVVTANMAIELLNMPEPPGCTAFVVSSAAGTFLGHNTDATKTAENTSVVMYWKPDNGDNSYITIDPAAWTDVSYGLNDKGIGITLNAGRPNVNPAMGLPTNFMVRYVMEHASSLAEAVNYFEDFLEIPGNSYGFTGSILLVVDFNDSSMARIEMRSEVIKVTYGEELKPGVTYTYTANHFLGDFNEDPTYYYESSWLRLERLLEILPTYETYDLATCLAIMTDHGEGDANNNTISREGGGFGATATVFSTVFTGEHIYYTIQRPHEYLETYPGPVILNYCGTSDDVNLDADSDGVVDCCDNCSEANPDQEDRDGDGRGTICDNCPGAYNPDQADTYPPEGNGVGDACDCEGDFDCSGSVDASDVTAFLIDFGRSTFNNPCTNNDPCNGDFDCNVNVDATDVTLFMGDFGRNQFNNPCPACVAGDWCVYP